VFKISPLLFEYLNIKIFDIDCLVGILLNLFKEFGPEGMKTECSFLHHQ